MPMFVFFARMSLISWCCFMYYEFESHLVGYFGLRVEAHAHLVVSAEMGLMWNFLKSIRLLGVKIKLNNWDIFIVPHHYA